MLRVVDVARQFSITTKIVVNKFNLNRANTKAIEAQCKAKDIEVIGYVPFSKKVNESLVRLEPIVVYAPRDRVSAEIISIWNKVK